MSQSLKSQQNGVDVYNQFIGGQWLTGDGELLDVLNPATGEVIARAQLADEKLADQALQAAQKAFPAWSRKTAVERADYLYRLVDLLQENRDRLARLITTEQGKPLSESDADVGMCCDLIRFAAENTRRLEGDIIPADDPDEQIWIQKVPHGVVVGITAWNFPAALIGRKLGPALAAGNTIVLKPSEETPLTALEIVELARQAGIPDGVVNLVNGRGRDIGNHLIQSPITQLISMTGSVRGGRISNTVDMTMGLMPANIQTMIAQNPKVTTWSGRTVPYGYLDWWPLSFGFNALEPPFDDPEVRWAINHAIDRDQLVDPLSERCA